jgi:hypothetical protein
MNCYGNVHEARETEWFGCPELQKLWDCFGRQMDLKKIGKEKRTSLG